MQSVTSNSAIELYRSLVMVDSNEGRTTSRLIAGRFRRTHGNVLKAIDRLVLASDSRKSEVTRQMFKRSDYIDSRGKVQRAFTVSKDGFMMLAMRFDGPDALEWQFSFIEAFNWLIDQLHEREENNRLIAQFDIKNRQSIDAGSYHGTGLQRRKMEIPVLEAEDAAIKAKVQASLEFDGNPLQVH